MPSRSLDEDDDRGWSDVDGTLCLSHIDDPSLRAVVEPASEYECSICGRTRRFDEPATARVFDSRSPSAPIASGNSSTVQVAGLNGLPDPGSGITAVAMNMEIIAGSGAQGHIEVYADDHSSGQSAQQFYSGTTTTTFATVEIGDDGGVTIHNGSAGTINVVLDVEGWFAGGVAPTVSCPTPYTQDSWSSTLPSSPVTCTINAVSGGSAQTLVYSSDAGDETTVALSLTGPTIATVTIPASAGEHEIDAYVTDDDGAQLAATTYNFGYGNWSIAPLTPTPSDTQTTSTAPTLSVGTSSINALSSSTQYQFTVSQNADGVTNPVTVSPASTSPSYSIPSGLLTSGQTYYWTVSVTGSNADGSSSSTLRPAPWSFTADSTVTDASVTTITNALTLVGYNKKIAAEDGFKIVTLADGSEKAIPVTLAAKRAVGMTGASNGVQLAGYNQVIGPCGYSWIQIKRGISSIVNIETGYTVKASVKARFWSVTLFGWHGIPTYSMNGATGSGPTWSRSIRKSYGGGGFGNVSVGSKVILFTGAVCVSGSPGTGF